MNEHTRIILKSILYGIASVVGTLIAMGLLAGILYAISTYIGPWAILFIFATTVSSCSWYLHFSNKKEQSMNDYRGTPASSQIIWLEKEIERLRRYEDLVRFIDSDYWELSYDKVQAMYADYKKRCRKLIEEDHDHDRR